MRIHFFFRLMLIFLWSGWMTSCSFEGEKISKEKLDSVLVQMRDYKQLQDRLWSKPLLEVMEQAYKNEASRQVIETAFVDFLNGDATPDAKKEILYYLGPVATGKSVETLFNLMSERDYFDATLYALSYIDEGSIDLRLVEKISTEDQPRAIAIINTLGDRANPEIITPLSELLNEAEPLRPYILAAMGHVPSQASAEVLLNYMHRADGEQKWMAAQQLIQVANELVEDDTDVSKYYEQVYNPDAPGQIIHGALRGFIAMGRDPIDRLTEIFESGDDQLISVVMPLIRVLNQSPPDDFISKGFEVLSVDHKANFLIALADRGVEQVKAEAISATQSNHSIYREAGLKALFDLGDESDVSHLAGLAATLKGHEKLLARKSLYQLEGNAIDKKIISEITNASGDVKEELVAALGHRNTGEAGQLLVGLMTDKQTGIRVAAIRSLGMAGEPDIIPEMISKAGGLKNPAELNQLNRSLTLIAQRNADESRQDDAISEALQENKDPDLQSILIGVLGNIANDDAYMTIVPSLKSENKEIRISAVSALSAWPTDRPLKDLTDFFVRSKDEELGKLALSGIERLVNRSENLSADERANRLLEVLKACKTDDERKIVLSGLGKTGSLITFEAAIELISSEELVSEAEAAILQNISNMDRDDLTAKVAQYLRSAREKSSNDYFKKELDKWLSELG